MSSSEPQLNTEQKTAVEYTDGALLIIAGAGTGKTTVIVEKIKHLIHKKLARPEEILALTFTEKAALEMQERVDQAMPFGYTQMWIMTFHSFCDRILRNDSIHIGLDPGYHLMTESESIQFLRKNLFKMPLNYFRPLGNPTKFTRGLINHFSRLSDEDITAEDYVAWTKKAKFETPEDEIKDKELAQAYAAFEELKTKESSLDFSNLISNTLKLFRKRPNVLKNYQKQFKYILVDEFQDTNISQNELVRLLVGDAGNLTVVADDDQSIYKWRGAAVSNVIQFRKHYPKLKIVSLTKNYRSSQSILDASYKLIQHNNPDRLEVQEKIDKRLSSGRNKKGIKPELIYVNRVENEAESVVKKIIELSQKEGYEYKDFAILVRANAHSEPFVRALNRFAVPYQFLGPGKLFKQPEIKEFIAYLKFLVNIEDSTCLYKVLTMDHFDINTRDIASIIAFMKRTNLTLFEAIEKVDEIFASPDTKDKVKELVKMINRHLKLVPRETTGQILYYFLEDSGMLQKFVGPDSDKFTKITQNLAKFFDKLKTFEVEHEDASVFAVVDWIELAIELGESPIAGDFDWAAENAINILTIHSSKGLEFPIVFVTNMVSGRFPTTERHEQIPIPEELIKEILPEGEYHQQEERRLFYVAATRAKDRLYLTSANYYGEGKREKKISPFVIEMLGEEVIKAQQVDTDQLSLLDFAPLTKKDAPAQHSQPAFNLTYLSFSQIDTFKICPLHYKLKYILKVPTMPSSSLSFGTSLHETLRQYSMALMNGGIPGEASKYIYTLYEKNWINLGYSDKEHELQMKKRGEDYIKAYLKNKLSDAKTPPLALEQPFVFPISPTLKVGGKIDRIDRTKDGIEIIDYKTTDYSKKELPNAKDLKNNLQLSMYALAAENIQSDVFKNHEVITLSLYLLDKDIKVSTTRTKEELEKAKQEILNIKLAIETSDFRCRESLMCQNCEFKLYCETA